MELAMSESKYTSIFSVAVSVDHSQSDPDNVPVELLIAAMENRIAYLKKNINEADEAFYHEDTEELRKN